MKRCDTFLTLLYTLVTKRENAMAKTIGTYDARTHWSEVLQEVKNGQRFILTDEGEAFAELVPLHPRTRQDRSVSAAAEMCRFMDRRTPIEVDIKSAIEEGRD
jgi:antitoxin (DNA-binding transcriptional repressor) of toxin-antitoxin stability system